MKREHSNIWIGAVAAATTITCGARAQEIPSEFVVSGAAAEAILDSRCCRVYGVALIRLPSSLNKYLTTWGRCWQASWWNFFCLTRVQVFSLNLPKESFK